MFISIVLNTEYMDISSRKMWYLKNLYHCKENGWILITHEYMHNHFEELQDSINQRFFDQFEMKRFSLDEIKDVEQYFIPDSIFDEIEKIAGSRTEMLFELSEHSVTSLDDCLRDIFEQIKDKHRGEKIDGILHCLEAFESLRLITEENNVPLINYSFSAFRKPHGYRQTLYNANLDAHYWDGSESEKRYKKFLLEDYSILPMFTNEEIITILGKEHTLPLIKLINNVPKYDMGICCECYSLLPQVFKNKRYLDDDVFYECKKLFGIDKIKVRSHAAHLNDIQVDRNEVHNDPASFILSCKRLTAVQSQILLKVLLWKRTAVMQTNCMGFSYLTETDYVSEKIADLKGLNYYIFGFLIPSDLMFSDEYWKWRLTNPSEVEIYLKHLNFLLGILGIDRTIAFKSQGKDRYRKLLETRNCDNQLIDSLLSDNDVENINWGVVSSQFEVITESCSKRYWRIDSENPDGSLCTHLKLQKDKIVKVKFYPLFDLAGFAKLLKVKLNGKDLTLKEEMKRYQYMTKINGCFEFILTDDIVESLDIECVWKYKHINDYLNLI